MRIAMVGPFGLHPNKTMRSRAFQLARPLIRRGHQVMLLMPPWHTPEEAGREWQEDGVEMRYVALNGGVPGAAARMVRETRACPPSGCSRSEVEAVGQKTEARGLQPKVAGSDWDSVFCTTAS